MKYLKCRIKKKVHGFPQIELKRVKFLDNSNSVSVFLITPEAENLALNIQSLLYTIKDVQEFLDVHM